MKINHEKITKEFCEDKVLIFYPKTQGEAALIQCMFFQMDHTLRVAEGVLDNQVFGTEMCVKDGMMIVDGKISIPKPATGEWFSEDTYLCTIDQFADNYVSLTSQFNDLSKRIAKLEKHFEPQVVEKTQPLKMATPS